MDSFHSVGSIVISVEMHLPFSHSPFDDCFDVSLFFVPTGIFHSSFMFLESDGFYHYDTAIVTTRESSISQPEKWIDQDRRTSLVLPRNSYFQFSYHNQAYEWRELSMIEWPCSIHIRLHSIILPLPL